MAPLNLKKTSENTMDSQRNKPMDHWTHQPEFSLEAEMTKLKLSYSGHLMPRPSSLEKWKKRKEDDQHQCRLLSCSGDEWNFGRFERTCYG